MGWKGNPRLEPLLIPVDSITTHPRNPRRGDLPRIAESLDAFGQTFPIVVQPGPDWIVAGNHTWRAATEILGWTRIAAIKPVLPDGEYEKYLLMDNRGSDVADYDDQVMRRVLDMLAETGYEHTGWDDKEAADFISATARHSGDAEFQGGYDEPPAPREARTSTNEQVLMLAYTRDGYQQLVRQLGGLRKQYGTDGTGDTILRAVDEQYKLVWNGS